MTDTRITRDEPFPCGDRALLRQHFGDVAQNRVGGHVPLLLKALAEAFVKEVGSTGMKRFASDLLRDGAAIARTNAETPFVWIVREGGSHLLFVHGTDNEDDLLAQQWDQGRTFGDEKRWVFAFDGVAFFSVAPVRVRTALAVARQRIGL